MAITANSPPDIDLENITLEDLTVVPDSSTSVLLEWKVVPTDGHYCIRNYNIQITGPNGSQWEEQIPGSNRGGVAGPAGPAKAEPLFSGSLVSFSDCRDSLRTR